MRVLDVISGKPSEFLSSLNVLSIELWDEKIVGGAMERIAQYTSLYCIWLREAAKIRKKRLQKFLFADEHIT